MTMTKDSLKENYTNCTKPLNRQKFWDYVRIVVHIVFTVCLVAAYVKAIGNGTDFVASRFIPYSVWSAVFGFGTYAMVRSIADIRVTNRKIKLFDDAYHSALKALDAAERENQKPIHSIVEKSNAFVKERTAFADKCESFVDKWGLTGDINMFDVTQHRLDEVKDYVVLTSEIKVTDDSYGWPDCEYYVALFGKSARVSKSVMMQMYQDLNNTFGLNRIMLIAFTASYVETYIKEHV